jgi:SAM-dependent methyltransferase
MNRSPYDSVAGIYDRHWGEAFVEPARTAIETWLIGLLRPHASLLDLCCGTGRIAGHLADLGYEVYGVDESAAMLSIARANAPHVHFQQADMAMFHWPHPFEAAVSFYNSLNHARSFEHLQRTLQNVAAHLRTGGFFLFDYVGPEGFIKDWGSTEHFTDNTERWQVDYRYNPETACASCIVNGTETIYQCAFDAAQIHHALAAAGFSIIEDVCMTATAPAGDRRLILAGKHKQ